MPEINPTFLSRPRVTRSVLRLLATALAAALVVYLGLAYLVTPEFWSHHSHQPGLADKPMVTTTKQGIAGDPINVGLVGTKAEIIEAMGQAGWSAADKVTLRSSAAIGSSVILNRAYQTAPISTLLYQGQPQALAFEKANGVSARLRHHVRFWPALGDGVEGRPVWLGAASFDRGVGVSRYTGQITHHIGPDLDAERSELIADLGHAHVLATIYQVSGVGPTAEGRNGGGDPYFTDGEVVVGVVTKDAHRDAAGPAVLADSPVVTTKNNVWKTIADLARRVGLIEGRSKSSDDPF